MTDAIGTALAIAFAPDRRGDLRADLAIVHAIAMRWNGSFEPGSESAICQFQSIFDCVQAAADAVDEFSRTDLGHDGVGIGIEKDNDPAAAVSLAERGLSGGSYNIFLTDAVHVHASQVAGVSFAKIVETMLPGRGVSNWLYSMTVQPKGLAAVVNATLSDDTAGWDAAPPTEPPSDQDETIADGDETVMDLADEFAPAGERSSTAAAEMDETVMALADDDETVMDFDPAEPGSAPLSAPDTSSADGISTLVADALPQGPAAAGAADVAALRNALDRMSECENMARQLQGGGRPYAAVYQIDLLLADAGIANLGGLEGPQDTLRALRRECLAGAAIVSDLVISGPGGDLFVYRGDALMIGRDPGDGVAGLKLGCRMLSRIPKQLRIDRDGEGYAIADLGSANGGFLDEVPLVANQRVPLDRLDQGMTVSLGGVLDPPEKGDCRLTLSAVAGSAPNLSIQVATGHLTGASRAELAANWPDLDRDCTRRWVFAASPILIGGGDDCTLRLPPGGDDRPQARIEWTDDGYALAPLTDQVMLDETPVLQPVLIADGATLQVLGQTFRFRGNHG
ncbi:MAG: hypothetical protein QF384_01810 [Alphaproteobacteria bacterium]|jgi:hypothetical protein|nr:hypothetical protein [Alphaproteobacteria bacterium]MDP6830882.1 hypothetical protein [Alphaproteobacteria bacterium]